MAGRRNLIQKEWDEARVIDAVLSLWQQRGEVLNFKAIHTMLVEKGVVQKPNFLYKTARILNRLEKMGLVEKIGWGEYKINVEPVEYRLFDQLERIRKVGMARILMGGFFWRAAEIYLLGFPETGLEYNYVKYAMHVIAVRLTQLFQALNALQQTVLQKGASGRLPKGVIRELILELPCYYLGARAGIDGDGLPTAELIKVYEKMLEALPPLMFGNGLMDSTCREALMEEFSMLKQLAANEDGSMEMEWMEEMEKEGKFALIVTPAEWQLDAQGWARREIISILDDEKDEDPLYLAVLLRIYDREIVLKTLEVEGLLKLGREKVEEVKHIYNRLLACEDLASCIPSREEGLTDPLLKQKIRMARRKAVDYAKKYGKKELVTLFPLTGMNIKAEDVKILFPHLSADTVEAWLKDGEEKFSRIRARLEEKLREAREKLASR